MNDTDIRGSSEPASVNITDLRLICSDCTYSAHRFFLLISGTLAVYFIANDGRS